MAAAPASSDELLDIVAVDQDHIKATAFNMLFMVWRLRTLADAYREGSSVVRRLGAAYPEGVGVCNVVEVGAAPPEPEARSVFVDFHRLSAVKHMSVVHEGTGFKAAAVRAIMSGVQALAKPAFAHSVQSDVATAAAWHADNQRALGRTESAARIAQVIQRLRQIQEARFPIADG